MPCTTTGIYVEQTYASLLYTNSSATLDDLVEAVNILEETLSRSKQLLGNAHPVTHSILIDHKTARVKRTTRRVLRFFAGIQPVVQAWIQITHLVVIFIIISIAKRIKSTR